MKLEEWRVLGTGAQAVEQLPKRVDLLEYISL